MVSEKSQVTVFSSNFSQGFARFGGISCFIENYNIQSTFTNCIFINNSALDTLIDLTNSQIIISGSTIENNSNIFLSASAASQIIFQDSQIKNHVCNVNDVGCLLNAYDNSIITINGVTLFNLLSLVGEGTIYSDGAEINLINSRFYGLKNINYIGSCVSLYSSILMVDNSSFEGYDLNCIFSTKKSQIEVSFSNFTQNNYQFSTYINEYGTIFCEDCLAFYVNSSFFGYNSKISLGSGIYLTSTKSSSYFDSETSLICNSYFLSNSALLQGGAIYAYDQNVTIIMNVFQNNTSDNGGAIFFDNSGI